MKQSNEFYIHTVLIKVCGKDDPYGSERTESLRALCEAPCTLVYTGQ